jgi:hypothetical protein
MKKIITILLSVKLLISCSAGREQLKYDHVSFSLPKHAKKITKEQLNPVNKRDQYVMEFKNIYQVIDDILITTTISSSKHYIEKDYLLERKKWSDNFLRDNDLIEATQYKSRIETVNNNEVLIMYKFSDFSHFGKYSFQVISNDNTQTFKGTVTFENKSNYEKATKILNDLIKSVKFK